MPEQLIYTSALRGVVAGQSGYCTVARSATMREALMLQLEKFCYYQHLSLSGGVDRPIFAYRIVDIRGARFHVVSRIQDAGLDYTGRTNFIAHHLAFKPEEIRQFPTPPVILRDWPGWVKSWTGEPQSLANEDWTSLTALTGKSNVPAQTWHQVTGDAINGYGLLEARGGTSFRADDQSDETILQLIAESLELLEVRDSRRDFRTTAWNYTFTTSMQEQDNPADFKWRCLRADNPGVNRLITPDVRLFAGVPLQPPRCTEEEMAFARQGRQPPEFAELTAAEYDIQEGAGVKLEVKTDGIPTPVVRWFEVERNVPKEMVGKIGPVQILNPHGRAIRYQAQAYNSSGSADSNVIEISIRAPARLVSRQPQSDAESYKSVKPALYAVKTAEDIEQDRERHRIKNDREASENKQRWSKIFVMCVAGVFFLGAGIFAWKKFSPPKAMTNNDQTPATNASLKDKDTGTGSVTSTNAGTTSGQAVQPSTNVLLNTHEDSFELSPPWCQSNIGNAKGNVVMSESNFILTASSRYKNNGISDNFLFVYQSVTNFEEFVGCFLSPTNKIMNNCGIMIRESKQTNAPFAYIGAYQNFIFGIQRPSAGANCTSTNLRAPLPPIFFKITRNNNTFIEAFSNNNTNWIEIETNDISMPGQDYLVGFAVWPESTNEISAKFNEISLKPVK